MSAATQIIGSVTPVVVVVAILALRARRLMQTRRLRLETVWLRPLVLIAFSALSLYTAPPRSWIAALILLPVVLIGSAIGWRQGQMMTITVEPESHQLNVRASPVAVLVVGGFLVFRLALRSVLTAEAPAWHLDIGLIVDSLILLITALYIAQAIEMYLRAKALLTEAKAKGARPG